MGLSIPQKEIANCKHRFRVAVCGRRFGKTHLAIRELARFATVPNSEVWYVAPTFKQAKQIVWKKLKTKLKSLNWVRSSNETNLSISLYNGSTITLKGVDNPDSLRGVGLHFLVLDEFADFKDSSSWFEVLRPTLADTGGHALFIGTPKGVGNWAHDIFNNQDTNPDWKSFQFTTIQGGNVSQSEIEAARRDLDERTFRQEFEATFESYSGKIYYGFDRKSNVYELKDDVYYNQTLHVGMDFNVNPMSAVVARIDGDVVNVVDEIRIFSSNTDEVVEEIKSRYSQCKIIVYPDPAGNQNKSSAGGRTDNNILANAGFVVKCPKKHTPVRDRINAVNARLCASNNTRHLFIANRCKHTIECLERQVYKEGTSIPDKDSGFDHMNDALGYMIDYLFPIRRDIEPITPQRWGHQ
jgi:hypothetical protein